MVKRRKISLFVCLRRSIENSFFI